MSPGYGVDTSVFLRWFVDQVGYEHAREVRDEFLAGAVELRTPDFTRIELANVLRKTALITGIMTEAEYLSAVRVLDDLGVEIVPLDADGLERAAALAARQSLRVYDALAASVALDRGEPLLTADARSARALAGVVPVEILRGIAP